MKTMNPLTILKAAAIILCLTLNLELGTSNCFAQVANGTGAGNCLSFDGNDYVNLGDVIEGYNDYSISAWIKIDATASAVENNIISKALVGGFYIYKSGSSFTLRSVNGDGTNWGTYVGSSALMNADIWYHVTAVHTGANATLYINGVQVATGSTGRVTGSNGMARKIGCHSSGIEFFKGLIDELTYWNRALTQTEIRDNMCKKLQGNESGLVGYWRFDEGSGGTAYDASPNGNNGTLY